MTQAQWRNLHLWDFKTFLEQAPRVGPLHYAYDGSPAATERLLRFYLDGSLSDSLLHQFQEWLKLQNA